jgi:hypothetical protein
VKGHEDLLALRRSGVKPQIVFINDFPCKTDWAHWGDYPTVCIHKDRLEDLDLRFLIGVMVSIAASNKQRERGLYEMAKSAGASTVACGNVIWHRETGEING